MTFIKATASNFVQDVIESDLPVLVKFAADSCAPCHSVAPIIESVAKDYTDRMKFVSVDIDESPEIAAVHSIRGVPAFIVIKAGKVADRLVGLQTRTKLVEFVESAIRAG